jgi:single-strand DNA-binding protein
MLNEVNLIGRLGADPETRYMPSGGAVTTITLATTRRWKDKQSGEAKEETEWHRVTFFGKLAEISGEYLKKGSQCYVKGRIKTTKYEKNGEDRYSTGIIADSMLMLGSKGEGGAAKGKDDPGAYRGPSNPPASEDYPFDDDIPF